MRRFFLKLKTITPKRAIGKLMAILFSLFSRAGRLFIHGEKAHLGLDKAEAIGDMPKEAFKPVSSAVFCVITDEFMYNSYLGFLNMRPLSPDSYKEGLEGCEAVLYITCWHGLNGEWRGEDKLLIAAEALRYARGKGIKTIFQSIEDPSNYERFLPVAREAEFIFTAAAESIPAYMKDAPNSEAGLLEYAVNPIAHSPIGASERLSGESLGAMFAGSWMKRYKERCDGMKAIFWGCLKAKLPLTIADRNSKALGRSFPLAYQRYVIDQIPHLLLQKAHKLFDWNISANSISDSQTMCSMRNYELQALCTNVISNYAPSIANRFCNIFIATSPSHALEIFSSYSRDDLFCFAIENVRSAFHTSDVRLRLKEVFNKTGIPYNGGEHRTLVLCDEKTDKIIEMFERQISKNADLAEFGEIESFEGYDSVCYFSPEIEYEEYYLLDMALALSYSGAEAVSAGPVEESFKFKAGPSEMNVSIALTKAKIEGGKVTSDRIFTLPPNEIGGFYPLRGSNSDKAISLVVPVYNNGIFLYNRAFRSLIRSSIFPDLSIYLIDDGSDDEDTKKIIKRLARRYPNVKYEFLEGGPSGSASRPRNIGIEASKEKYIAFLDPDNEAVGDSYRFLYEDITSYKADFAFGAYRKAKSEKLISYQPDTGIIEGTRESLEKSKFRAHSIQSCLYDAAFLKGSGIKSPAGGIGQDTLFFYETMAIAKKAHYRNHETHIYYDERGNSATNIVTKSFFEKMLITEACQKDFLEREGLIEAYKASKLDRFIVEWYLAKLKLADEPIKNECLGVIGQILDLYGKRLVDYKPYLDQAL